MNSHDELLNLEYVAYDHVSDFMEKTANRKMIDPHVDVGFFYDGDTPVVEVSASGLVEGSYVERYVLDGMSIEAFEELGYDVWTHGFEDSFHSVSQIGELLEE